MSVVDDVLQDLQRFYGRQLNDAQAGFWRSQMAQLDEDDLCAGVVALKGREPILWLPNIVTIRKYVNEAREARLNREKERAPVFSDLERNANRTRHGRESIALIRRVTEGKLSRDECLAGMYEMDRKYPAYGWAGQADELRRFWLIEKDRHEIGKDALEGIARQ